MSSNEVFQPSTIELSFKGLMVMFTNNSGECKVGLLRDAPGHNHQIIVQKKATGTGSVSVIGSFTKEAAEGSFDLNVQNVGQPGIRKRGEFAQFDRFAEPDSDSVNWLMDLERDFFEGPLGARKDGFVSFITLNNGEIFTRAVSRNHLQYKRPNSTKWIHFGRVAVEMGIEIKLDKPESRASFTKTGESQPIFVTEPATNYQILVERTEPNSKEASGHDANLYFQAIGAKPIPPGQQIEFRSVPRVDELSLFVPSTPDAACPVNHSQSDLS